ncbi:MAG: DUF5662 family protein [Bacilli bacterium]|nr:DUF5662 family protein [Bacilli bacterium]
MGNSFKHFRTITKHRHQVIRNASHCGIFWTALDHDLTKYSYAEFHTSAKYYSGTHSPIFDERMNNSYFSHACQHHTHRNKHHWEYWTGYFMGRIVVCAMPWKYATELVCDMLAAAKTYDPKGFGPETTLNYFLRHSDAFYMATLTREYVKWCFERYRDLGFKGLKKKDTKAKYAELEKAYPKYEVISELRISASLPPLK